MDNPKKFQLTDKQKCDAFLRLLLNQALYEVYVDRTRRDSFNGYEIKITTYDYKKVAAVDQLDFIHCVYYPHIPIERIDGEDYITIRIW